MSDATGNGSFPLIGDPFPKMTVKTTHGELVLPDAYKGKWVVLFSHPGDFTPVCTTEFYSFSKMEEDFRAVNTELIGLSIDQVFSHIKWVEWINEKMDTTIGFPVIADDQGNISKKLGMLHPGKGSNTVRAVFIIDADGVVRLILYYPQEIGRNMSEILRAVKALQTSDANKVAMPANWPNNELLGDKVINPPPTTEADAKTRMDKFEGYDWWFTYKNLD